ncbi:MAG: hypothetical protein M3N93_10805 [Acidobacteriota bacterium]|nr:hypothetical protein [Acidobacteriota bacterium]
MFPLLQPAPHFVIFHELAPVGGGNAALNPLKKLSAPFQHPGNRFLNYTRGVLAFAGRELLKLRLYPGEMRLRVRCRAV